MRRGGEGGEGGGPVGDMILGRLASVGDGRLVQAGGVERSD